MTKPTKWRVPSKDSDQPGFLPILIRVFAVCMKKAWVLRYPLSTQQRLWLDWADAQADLSLCWVHMPFCWFCQTLAHLCIRNVLFVIPVSIASDMAIIVVVIMYNFCTLNNFWEHSFESFLTQNYSIKYSLTSITRTPHLPWLIRTHFWVPMKFFQ